MRRLWTVALAGLTAALLQSGLPVQAGEPMRVRLAPSGGWISAEGEIRADTLVQFGKVLSELDGRKLPVVINSPGGRLSAALAIGRMIRRHGLAVTVEGTCTSACPFVLAGGVERRVELGSIVGVHQALMIRSGSVEANGNGKQLLSNSRATAKQFRLMRSKLRFYLGEMGVSPELVSEMEKASPFEMNVLNSQRLQELKLVTVETIETTAVPPQDMLTSSMEPLP